VLLRLACLTVTNTFAALRLLPMGDRDKDVEILALRHQITVLERQLGADTRARFAPEDRAFLAALVTSLPREILRRLRLVVHPDTVLRWHRDLMKRRHARTCRPKRPGRPPTVRSIRALILRLVRENPGWGYRRMSKMSRPGGRSVRDKVRELAADIKRAGTGQPAPVILAHARRGFVVAGALSGVLDEHAVPRRAAYAVCESACQSASELLGQALGEHLVRRYSCGIERRDLAQLIAVAQAELDFAAVDEAGPFDDTMITMGAVLREVLDRVAGEETVPPMLRDAARKVRVQAEVLWSHYGGDAGGV
jgi:hypothetical protein